MALYVPGTGASETSPVLVSRQPVLDARDRVVGYRVSYALLSGGFPVMPTADEALSIVDDVMSVIGRDEQLLGSRAHLPVSREMLLRGWVPSLHPDQFVLRIRYEDAVAQRVAPVIETAASRGYSLELDGIPGPGVDLSMIDYFNSVEVDFSSWSMEEAAGVLTRIRGRRALGLAAGVTNHGQRNIAHSLGFDWFSGPFFATPNLLAGAPIPIGDLSAVVELYRLQRGDAPLEEVVALIEREVGLGVRLLRYINSAYFGFNGNVRSITQAATMLGLRGLSRWALIVAALSGSKPIPRELQLLALTRGRACELVGLEVDESLDSDDLFTIGLLSSTDAIFRMPMAKIVDELPLADQIADALLQHDGPAGAILESVLAYEHGEFLAPTLRATLLENSGAYRDALQWARTALDGMA